MMLEVRNDDWTEEKIQEYCKFLTYVFKTRFEENNNDPALMLKNMGKYKNRGSYDNIHLIPVNNRLGCIIQKSITIRAGDLAIIPCHRLGYNKFVAGKFNDDFSLEASNIAPFVRVQSLNANLLPICEDCGIKSFCIKGCLGSQYESNKDLMLPINSVCKMFKARFETLLKLYLEYGLIEEMQKTANDDVLYRHILSELKKVPEDFQKDNILMY